MRHFFCLTWVQSGRPLSYPFDSYSVPDAIALFSGSLSDNFSDSCGCHRLMDGHRLLARQAIYTGV